jgi:2-dehydro-3-deoxygluconokinase
MADRLPGLYYIETDDTGERTFYYWRNEAAAKFWLESEQAAQSAKSWPPLTISI